MAADPDAAEELDAAMHLLDQEDEGTAGQPAGQSTSGQPTAEQLTAGLNRMLSNMAKIGPPPTVTGSNPPLAEHSNSLPFAYNRVRAARRNAVRVTMLTGLGGINRVASDNAGNLTGGGSFVVGGDNRYLAVQHIHDIEKKLNVSTTVSPNNLRCLVCPEPHVFPYPGRGGGSAQPAVIVATDHCFPAALPALGGGACVVVVRVEDGTLSEIRSTVKDMFTTVLPPGGSLPSGSVILMGSASYLGRVGAAQYSEELARQIGGMESDFGTGVTVVPGVALPPAAINSPTTIADLFDFDSWCCTNGLGSDKTMEQVRSIWWAKMGGGEREAAPRRTSQARTLNMPANFRNQRRFRFDCGQADLPTTIPASTADLEKEIIGALYDWLNKEYSTGLDKPNLCRLGGAAEPAGNKGRVFFIGASHSANIVARADSRAIHLLPRWKATQDVATLLASRLDSQNIGAEDTVVMDLLSNTVVMGSDESGMPAYPFKDIDGYHIPGNMEGAPTGVLKAATRLAKPLLVAASKAGKIILLDPLPRYTTKKCCQKTDHITNYADADYLETVETAVKNAHKALAAEAAAFPKAATEDPLEGFQAVEGNLVSSAGLGIWADGVHLTATAYADIWKRLVEVSLEAGRPGGGQVTLRYPAIVNTPIDRRMLGEPAAPGWLTGRPEKTEAYTGSRAGTARGPASTRDGRSERSGRHRFSPY